MKYILNSSFTARKVSDDKYLIGSTLDKQFEIELDRSARMLLALFGKACTVEEALKQTEGALREDEVREIVQWAIDETILVPDFEEQRLGQSAYHPIYDRQIRLFEELSPGLGFEAQQKLTNSKVVLLGVGGTGSYILYTLAAMGTGFVRAVDFDEVQLSNLSRQILYNRADVGKLKIDCARERIRQLNPDLNYEYVNKKIETEQDIEELIKGFDFCILSADTPRKKIKMMANNVSVRLGIPYIYGGSLVDSVGVGPLVIPGKTKDFSHVAPELDDTEDAFTEAFDSSFVSTLIDPYNALAASFTALECVKYLTGFSEPTLINKIMIINLKNYETTMADI
ncbi:HesA/MoeB/ThiF family protein [Pantoea ananatis]|uniref:ThiF family adenylyltransferase n=1 Tax=Pantoea ananas TaxID=553 RepID=A0A8A4KAA5_PANAN|nr:ThiF family adenylyltransferase [Pantoea ananatis]QTC48382.1 ThiF family adenylyltransferase [Pantoea ananatis]